MFAHPVQSKITEKIKLNDFEELFFSLWNDKAFGLQK